MVIVAVAVAVVLAAVIVAVSVAVVVVRVVLVVVVLVVVVIVAVAVVPWLHQAIGPYGMYNVAAIYDISTCKNITHAETVSVRQCLETVAGGNV